MRTIFIQIPPPSREEEEQEEHVYCGHEDPKRQEDEEEGVTYVDKRVVVHRFANRRDGDWSSRAIFAE